MSSKPLPTALTISERERMQLHAYYTDRMLRRGSLAGLADLGSAAHERLDGSGRPEEFAQSIASEISAAGSESDTGRR